MDGRMWGKDGGRLWQLDGALSLTPSPEKGEGNRLVPLPLLGGGLGRGERCFTASRPFSMEFLESPIRWNWIFFREATWAWSGRIKIALTFAPFYHRTRFREPARIWTLRSEHSLRKI